MPNAACSAVSLPARPALTAAVHISTTLDRLTLLGDAAATAPAQPAGRMTAAVATKTPGHPSSTPDCQCKSLMAAVPSRVIKQQSPALHTHESSPSAMHTDCLPASVDSAGAYTAGGEQGLMGRQRTHEQPR